MEAFVEPLDDNDTVAEQIGNALRAAQKQGTPVDDKLVSLLKAEQLLLTTDNSKHLLDNFLDEMLEFALAPDFRLKCFVASFIEKACKFDPEVMKKAIGSLSYLLTSDSRGSVRVMKRVITVCACLYPLVLKWAVTATRADTTEVCWEAFCVLKGRIMQNIETDNEGVRTMTFKFLESLILAQSNKTDDSESGRGDIVNLSDVPSTHRFISLRKLAAEANHNMQCMCAQTRLSHISAQNLLTALNVICSIGRQRPKELGLVMDSLEALHVNLPPTLGTSQVKSVRKELKMHLLRILRHPAAIQFHPRIVTLLTDLGATQNEMNRAMPANLAELKRKAKRSGAEAEPTSKRVRTSVDAAPEGPGATEEDEYADEGEQKTEVVTETNRLSAIRQTAIDITAQFVFDRLNCPIVANLVFISLATLPDQMPPAFASSYTPIAAAGTEPQRRHLSRMLSTQITQDEIGPGWEQMKEERLKEFNERQSARREGAYIPPTPAVHQSGYSGPSTSSRKPPVVPKGMLAPPSLEPKAKVTFNLINATRQLSRNESTELFTMAINRVLGAERRAVQGGAGSVHNVVVVRLATRFDGFELDMKEMLTEFIVAEHKTRTDLALLWLAELYSQFQGFSFCYNMDRPDGTVPREQRLDCYDGVMCTMLQKLFEGGHHKEALFHKILLESPLVTETALQWLKVACLDQTYGAFGMTTLRELILTRSRQRIELLKLLFELVFYEQPDTNLRQSCVDTTKELCELSYLKDDVSKYLILQLEMCTAPTPPSHFLPHLRPDEPREWSENVFRTALVLYLAVLPMDPTLLLPLAETYANSYRDFKTTVIRSVDSAVRAIGIHHPEMLLLVEKCPVGAESFVARVVNLLTERNPVTKELVDRLKQLHEERQTDVRSLIPVLNGLSREDVIRLLPKFVLKVANQKTVQSIFKKILNGRNIDTGEPVLSAVELVVEYHQIQPSTSEETKMQRENLIELLDALSKDTIANAVDTLLGIRPLPPLFFDTLSAVYKKYQSLDSFLMNVVHKMIGKELWQDSEESKRAFFRVLNNLGTIAYTPILTGFSSEEFKQYAAYLTEKGNRSTVMKQLRDHLPSLSTHQNKAISSVVMEMINEGAPLKERRVRDKEEKDRDTEKDKEREERREKERERGRKDKDRREPRRAAANQTN